MSLRTILIAVILVISLSGCFKFYQQKATSSKKTSPFEQLDFQALLKRYLKKEKFNSIEGIYSVSGSVTKKAKGLMSSAEKEKVTDRKENYAQVAIIKDPEGSGRDFIELSVDKEMQTSYSIVGEFTTTTSSNLLVYKHLDAKNKNITFTFTADEKWDILEGIRTENDGSATITYHLTYVKIYPK